MHEMGCVSTMRKGKGSVVVARHIQQNKRSTNGRSVDFYEGFLHD